MRRRRSRSSTQFANAFPKEVFEDRKYEGIDDERPVFIIGMPRSGSTLVEQILSSHPESMGLAR
jgi:hypothetical protein